MSMSGKDGGFSLLETLVALTIMSLAGVMLLKGFASQARSVVAASRVHHVVALIETLIDTAGARDENLAGTVTNDAEVLAWTRSVHPVEHGLVRIEISVNAGNGRSYRAEALRWPVELQGAQLP
jgi:prepilin-type N-terminal cleavage/methylation domain-containing protein